MLQQLKRLLNLYHESDNLYFFDLQVNKKPVATEMFSADGEFVPFNKAVPLDNPVEVI